MTLGTAPWRDRTGEISKRPFAFLVSTTACSRDITTKVGAANYSYYFAVKALAPALEALGTWQLVDQVESRLPYLAGEAEAQGYRPVHLSVHPPHDSYLSSSVPNVFLTFWEFPEVPNRSFGTDTRQDWSRIARAADLILAPCRLTAAAFRSAGVTAPIADITIPLSASYFDVPAWDPARSWTISLRHETWVGGPFPEPADRSTPRPRFRARVVSAAKRRVIAGYRKYVGRWLSDEARGRFGMFARGLAGRKARGGGPRLLPSTPLTLNGLVYTSVFNATDIRKNPEDTLSAFLIAFRNRPDANLVLKLNCPPEREWSDLRGLRRLYERMGLRHKCKVVVITDYMDEAKLLWLYRASTYYINTSRAEGACMPLQEALASGRPALAPDHTAMADYFDDRLGFVIRSTPEPIHWPHDPERRLETTCHHLAWSDIRDHFLSSAALIDSDRAHYDAMAQAARERMRAYAGQTAVVDALRRALARLPDRVPGDLRQAS
jgi:glycosyltransferase involved in cell wall biosynthesis